MDFPSAPSMRAKRQRNHVLYDAKKFIETICTRLDAFGRVFKPVIDGVDGGGLVVEKMLNGEDVVGNEKRRSKSLMNSLGKVLNIRLECRLGE